jgi:uncharacterized membrane protein
MMLDNDEWITGGVMLTLASIMLSPMFLYIDFGEITSEGVWLVALTLPLELLGYYLFLTSIKRSALSLTLPLLSFTPALTIVSASSLLDETIGSMGLVGVLLVTVGAYILNVDPSNFSVMGPVRAVVSDSGARRMLMVAVIWSITSALGKRGVIIFGALQFGYLITALIGIIFLVVGFLRVRLMYAPWVLDGRIAVTFVIAAIVMSFQEVTHFLAVSMAPVAYMISVKRVSMVIGVIFGWRFFGEANILNRLAGALIMLAGVSLLSGLHE